MHQCEYVIKNKKGIVLVDCDKSAKYVVFINDDDDTINLCSKHAEITNPFTSLLEYDD